MRVIKFYKVKKQSGRFFNFAADPAELEGKVGPTSGHYFRAQKSAGTEFGE